MYEVSTVVTHKITVDLHWTPPRKFVVLGCSSIEEEYSNKFVYQSLKCHDRSRSHTEIH